MNKTMNIIIIVGLIIVVGIVIAVKQHGKTPSSKQPPAAGTETATSAEVQTAEAETIPKNLPKLVDLGAGKCIPCKMMAPILEELKEEYSGKLDVVFIDVWENPDEAKQYGIQTIPTQIFYDSTGKELFRHEGFFSKEDILGKWKEFGIELKAGVG